MNLPRPHNFFMPPVPSLPLSFFLSKSIFVSPTIVVSSVSPCQALVIERQPKPRACPCGVHSFLRWINIYNTRLNVVTSKRRKQIHFNESSEKNNINLSCQGSKMEEMTFGLNSNLNCWGSEMEEMAFGLNLTLIHFITQPGGWYVNCSQMH